MSLICSIEGCSHLAERNGICGTHNREARKKAAPKEKPRKTRISKVADKERMSTYYAIEKLWKAAPENWYCYVCVTKETSEPHHQMGRIGDLLYDVRYWLPVCRKCHQYIETHPQEAYERGWSLLRNANESHTI